ncbi:Hsp70 family protein [Lysobacter koreensis]|uniref:Hsp70 family protein n=1 Tax=Lysobacter koreensis TaxID=266122 RepID=A0ABW2YT94_9GAMM
MRIGIDFGTSYSAAGALVDDRVQLVRFGDALQFRTTAFFPHAIPDPNDFALTPALEAQVARLLASAKAAQTRALHRANLLRAQAQQAPVARRAEALALVATPSLRSDEQLRREAVVSVRRHWLEQQMQQARASAASLQHAVYGDDAIDAYLAEGGGHLVDSPKSMLGYRLHGAARHTILGIATHILEHIRLTAGQQLGTVVRGAVIGRPVEFRSSMGEAGGVQALEILREAASAAGFDAVEFLEEPAAAALDFHRSQAGPQRALIVDVGGGTTDVAFAQLGGRAARPRIRGAWGIAEGGVDVDLALSLRRFMPLFGKDLSAVPVHRYSEAASVHDLQRQRDFRRCRFDDAPAPFASRLAALQAAGNTVRLNRSVELAKIGLSEHASWQAGLDYIEPGLAASATREHLEIAAARFLGGLERLLARVGTQLDAAPTTLFVTGGMSRAPYVRAAVQAAFPDARLVAGDPSLGVVSGLAVAAGGRPRTSARQSSRSREPGAAQFPGTR